MAIERAWLARLCSSFITCKLQDDQELRPSCLYPFNKLSNVFQAWQCRSQQQQWHQRDVYSLTSVVFGRLVDIWDFMFQASILKVYELIYMGFKDCRKQVGWTLELIQRHTQDGLQSWFRCKLRPCRFHGCLEWCGVSWDDSREIAKMIHKMLIPSRNQTSFHQGNYILQKKPNQLHGGFMKIYAQEHGLGSSVSTLFHFFDAFLLHGINSE